MLKIDVDLARDWVVLGDTRESLPPGGGALLCDYDRCACGDHESGDHDHCGNTLHDIDLLRANSFLMAVMPRMVTGT
jgi:hypothetical protein